MRLRILRSSGRSPSALLVEGPLRGLLGRTAGLLALLLGAAQLAAVDLPGLQKRGVLRVLCILEPQAPEFVWLGPEHPPGFDREVLESFARVQNLKVEFVAMPGWDALLPALAAGKGDMIAGRYSDTPARRQSVDFTQEVVPTRVVVANLRPAPPVNSVDELRALKVGTIKGTSMEDALLALGIPPARIEPIRAGEIVTALRGGRVQAVAWSLEGALQRQRREPDVQLGVFLGSPESLAYAVPKGHPLLLKALNGHLDLMRTGGHLNRLLVKYFGANAPVLLRQARDAR